MYDWMLANAERTPARPAFVAEGRSETRAVTWAELADSVERIRGGLRDRRVRAGERVAISMSNGPELVESLLAVVAEAAIAVILPTPNGRRDGAYLERALGIWADCDPVLLIEDDSLVERRTAFEALSALPAATAGSLLQHAPVAAGRSGRIDTAFLQYTSGSTKQPRGVVVTTGMLEENCRQAQAAYGDTAHDTAVTWVPLYHDMGLVTGVVRPLHFGYSSVLMEPTDFVVDPLGWLRAMSDYGATLSSAPDFGYAHCARKLRPEDLVGLDLSRWRIARNAGEMVRAETMDAFLALTRDAGFSDTAFCPSYGMAEATLTVTATTPADPPRRIRVDESLLSAGDTVAPDRGGRLLLSSGPALEGTSLRAGDPDTPDGVVGELRITGPQVASSYFTSPMPHADDGALRTGDLGFVLDGHLFVLGRHDDVLVANGVNYFQHDITMACATLPGLRPGRIAAFLDDRADRRGVVVVAETRAGADTAGLPASIQRRVHEAVGLIISQVELALPGSIPVTTSGKVRVSVARNEYFARTPIPTPSEKELSR